MAENEKHIIFDELKPEFVGTEDGGQFKFYGLDQSSDEDNGMYVRLCSWDETKTHTDFNKFLGKKVKVTIETVEFEDADDEEFQKKHPHRKMAEKIYEYLNKKGAGIGNASILLIEDVLEGGEG